MDLPLSYKNNSKILWKYNKFNVFASSQRNRNVLLRRFAIVALFTFMVLFVMRENLRYYYEEYLAEGEVLGWEKYRNRSIPHYILPNERTTILEPSTLCKEHQPLLLLIVILSKPHSFAHRQNLRRTWANTTEFNYSKFAKMHEHLKDNYLPITNPEWIKFVKKDSNSTIPVTIKEKSEDTDNELTIDYSQFDFHIRTVFLIGQTKDEEIQNEIFEESQAYDDIIQEAFLDTYNNLTIKSSMLMKWLNNNCLEKVKFAMKVDDDNFINVPNLIHYLLGGTIPFYNATLNRYKEQNNQNIMDTLDSKNRLTDHENLLVGSMQCHIKPCTLLHDKWFTPRYMFDDFIYPNFLFGGGGFAFTMDTAAKLYNASMEIPFLIFEDVYFTGLCAEKSGIKPRNYHLFNNGHYLDMCEFRGIISQHQTEPRIQKLAYDLVLHSSTNCVGPSHNIDMGVLNDTNEYCSNKYTFGYPRAICASPFYSSAIAS